MRSIILPLLLVRALAAPTQTPCVNGFAGTYPCQNVDLLAVMDLAGMWWMKPWAAYLVMACGIAVIAFDIYFGIWYHLYVAIPSTLILLFFIIKYWNEFK